MNKSVTVGFFFFGLLVTICLMTTILGQQAQATVVPKSASLGDGLVERESTTVCCGHGTLSAMICVTHLIFFLDRKLFSSTLLLFRMGLVWDYL